MNSRGASFPFAVLVSFFFSRHEVFLILAVVSGDPSSMTLSRTISLAAFASISIGASVLAAEIDQVTEAQVELAVSRAVTGEDLAALANEVNLPAWMQLASRRDLTSIDEGWVTVYSPKDPVGAAHDWSEQVKTARFPVWRAQWAFTPCKIGGVRGQLAAAK